MISTATVLVVDDEPPNRKLLEALLRPEGYRTQMAGSGEEALLSVAADPPDLILLDIMMPGMDGFAVATTLKANPATSHIPIVMVTASVGREARLAGLNAGAEEFLQKPVDRGELWLRVRNLLRLKSLSDFQKNHNQMLEQEVQARTAELQRFRAAMEISGDAIVLVDRASLRYIDVNQTLCNMVGYTRDELLRMTPMELFGVERAVLERAYDAIIADNNCSSSTIAGYYRHRNGSLIPIETRRRALHAEGGWIIVGNVRDVTERKNAEEEQRATRQLLDNIIENIPTAVQLKSVRDGFRIQMWNKAAEAMYGLPREAAIGRNVHDLWPGADADRMHAADVDLLEMGGIQDIPDRPALTRDRGPIRVHMRKLALTNAAGSPTHLLVVSDDMTVQLADQARLRESEARFRSLTELSSDWFWEQDVEHRFVNFTGGDNVEGWGPDQKIAVGLHRWDLGGVVPISSGWDDHKGLLDARKPFRNFEYKRTLDNGKLQYVAASGAPVFDAGGMFTGYRGVALDITDRKKTESRLARLNRVYAFLSGINALIVRVHDRDQLFREACQIAVEHGKFTMAWIGVVDRSEMKLVPVASAGTTEDHLTLINQRFSLGVEAPLGNTFSARAIRDRKIAVSNDVQNDPLVLFKEEHALRGSRSMAMLPLLVADEVAGILALYSDEIGFFDEEELKLLSGLAGDISFAIDGIEKQARLDYLAFYDALTGLANRTLLLERLAQYMRSAAVGGHQLALFLVDLERFKSINDSLGRPTGDALLMQVAKWLTLNTGDAGLVARVGADHFALILPVVSPAGDVARLLEKTMAAFQEHPFRLDDNVFRVAAKVGVALFPDDGADADTLLKHAEAALKKAKASGEKYLFFSSRMTETVAGNLTLENQLRLALDREEFVLHYQPKVNLVSGKLAGAEALIRWNDPRTGLVPPGRFIPVLEDTGLITDVGRWALRKALEDYLRWCNAGLAAVRVAVNVSPLQLRHRRFAASIGEVLAIDARAAAGLELEITESLVMEDIKHSIATLRSIRELGVTVAIDDFGTGFSSLSYLARLPVDTLKIDRSFVTEMTNGPQGLALVSTIINLAQSLKLKVVAEGVETEEQSRLLRLLRCDELQGFLFSKPVPVAAFEAEFLIATN